MSKATARKTSRAPRPNAKPPKVPTHRITVELTEGQPPHVSWPGLDAYSVPSYLRKAAIYVESTLGLRE